MVPLRCMPCYFVDLKAHGQLARRDCCDDALGFVVLRASLSRVTSGERTSGDGFFEGADFFLRASRHFDSESRLSALKITGRLRVTVE